MCAYVRAPRVRISRLPTMSSFYQRDSSVYLFITQAIRSLKDDIVGSPESGLRTLGRALSDSLYWDMKWRYSGGIYDIYIYIYIEHCRGWNRLIKFAGSNFEDRKYREGHRLYNTKDTTKEGAIFNCGIIGKNGVNFLVKGACLKTGRWSDGFYEINGEIKPDGDIVQFTCKCPAGVSEQCKHIIGVLFYCL